MTDAPEQQPAQTQPEQAETPHDGDPTPEERLAENSSDDLEVGADGTGMGELP